MELFILHKKTHILFGSTGGGGGGGEVRGGIFKEGRRGKT